MKLILYSYFSKIIYFIKIIEKSSEENYDKIVNEIQNQYRIVFENTIIELKSLTNKCQGICYKKYPTQLKNLLEIESCTDKCYTPLFSANELITNNVILDKTEKLEKCKIDILSKIKDVNSNDYL